MDCTGDATCKQADPHFITACSLFTFDVHWASKINSCIYAKGGASLTRNKGSGGAGGAVNGLPSNRLQMTHLWMMERTRLLPPIIQYFARISVRVSFTPLRSTLKCAL